MKTTIELAPIGDNLDMIDVELPGIRGGKPLRVSARWAVFREKVSGGIYDKLPPHRILLAFCARHNARIVNAKR